jgi:integrase
MLEAYIAARKTLSAGSVREYRRKIETHLQPWLDLPLRYITPDMVEVRHRAIPGEIAKAKRYSGNTAANLAMKTLSLLWNFAAERDPALPSNPVRRLRRQWYPTQRRERHIKQDNIARFYAAVCGLENTVARDWILLMLHTGLRRRESAALRWEHIDFSARIIHVPANLTKNKQPLDLPMTTYVHDLLKARREQGNAKFIFPSYAVSGHIEEAKHVFEQVATACDIVVSAHDLRRTYITIADSCDISYAALKQLVNHSMKSDVTRGYIQMEAERLRKAAQTVCDKLLVLCGVGRTGKVVQLR